MNKFVSHETEMGSSTLVFVRGYDEAGNPLCQCGSGEPVGICGAADPFCG